MPRSLVMAGALLLALGWGNAASAVGPDWKKWADLQTVEVISTEAGGGSRQTTVWIVVVDGQAYIRTGGTRWGNNVEREGRLKLHGEPGEYALRAEKVTDPAVREAVMTAFREKYGNSDWILGFLRFGEVRIFRLSE